MKPQLGDTILNRYTLVSALREEPGLEAWKANDRILAKDCELYLVTDKRQLDTINDIAGTITATRPAHFMPVQKFRRQGDTMLVITPVDNGKSLTEYLSGHSHVLGADAIRSIIGELSEAIAPMLGDRSTAGIVLNSDTVRITSTGIEITGAPFAPLLADTSGASLAQDGPERHAVRQLAALLYAMLIKQRNPLEPRFSLDALPQNMPGEFQVICKRGLELFDQGDHSMPMASLAELDALLGDWKPLTELDDTQITLPTVAGDCSIIRMLLNPPADDAHIAQIPESLIARKELPDLQITQTDPVAAAAEGNVENGQAAEEPGRHLFDFKFSDAWNSENLSGDDTADWFNTFNAGAVHPAAPLSAEGVASAGETTSRIPIYDAGGREIQPGEESLRALEEEQARIAEVAAVPPSYDPKNPPVKSSTEDDHLPNENLFGSFTTKVVALIVALVVVIAAGFWAWSAFQKSGIDPADATNTTKSGDGEWPDVNMNEVPFGKQKLGDESSDSADSSDTTQSNDSSSSNASADSSSSSSKSTAKKKASVKKVVKDKTSKSVPQPHVINTTAYTISSANFVSDPGGQSGYGYVMHLDQAHDVSRVVITIRSSGGKGYIRANTTGDPNQGTEVGSFTFAEGGTTEIKLNKTVNTQDLMLWVPINSLPQNQLYIQKVEVF